MKRRSIITLVIGLIIGLSLSGIGTYAATNYAISANKISYSDNSNLGVDNVQAAIDGTCVNFSTKLNNMMEQIYPVGSIYMSTSISDPKVVASTLGVGTWDSYAAGRTLIGVGSNGTTDYKVNTTGGTETSSMTLTTENLPSHSHTYDKSSSITGSHVLTIAEMPSHNHVVQFAFAGNSETGSVNTISGYPILNKSGEYNLGNVSNTGGNAGHTHSISLSSASTGTVGSSKPININSIQPYITVYMYKRTK